MTIQQCKRNVLDGKEITKEEALFLAEADLEELSAAADEIRRGFCGNDFDMCSVISVKGGRCPENCRFCSQASCSAAKVEAHALLDTDTILNDARLRSEQGICHYCLVSSGRRLSEREVDQICESIREICANTSIKVCTSLGLLDEAAFRKLKKAGVSRIHNNLETSRSYFPSICTSHTYEDKLQTIHAARRAGLEICCGGIFGIGETMEDRIDMALVIRQLDVTSVPVNLLDPVPGTPLGSRPVLTQDVVRRIIALYRFLLPKVYIRLAAGRDYLKDAGLSCFLSGSNATITGDMLTVMGISVTEDLRTIRELGYHF
ncbi:MAG: biotin synthase BioB [Lachnospiraceae bacterium]|nr:biotin synthase BioB [Lachnospiraceae bacterium]